MANASLTPIYNRLNNAPKYHPLTAETFADWAMEAGDLVTVSRDGNSYTSPVSTSRMVWRGRQQISIESTGSKERPAISKVSRQKYSGSRGAGAAIANNNYIYNEVGTRARVFVSYTDPALTNEVSEGDFWVKSNETETWNDLSASTWTYSSVFNWNDYKGALVYVRDSKGTWRLVSDQQTLLDHSTRIEQDENHISLIAQDVEKVGDTVYRNYAELKVEQAQISADVVNAYAGLQSNITQTASSIMMSVEDSYNQMKAGLDITSSSITSYVDDRYNGISSSLVQTASTFTVEVGKRAKVFVRFTDPALAGEDVQEGDFWVKTNETETWNDMSGTSWTYSSTFNWNDYKGALTYVRDSKGGWRLISDQQTLLDHTTRIEQDEDHISLIAQDIQKIDGEVYRNYAELKVEQAQIKADVVDAVDELESHIVQTASSIMMSVEDNYNQLKSGLDLTSSSAALYVENKYTQMSSGLALTSSSAALYVENKYTQMSSGLALTSSSAALYVENKYTQMSSGLKLSSSSAALYVDNKYDQMKSGLALTSSSASLYVDNKYDQLKSGLALTSSSAAVYVNDRYNQMKAGLAVTSSSAAVYATSADAAAKIVAEVNKTGSTIRLDADRVLIADNVTIDDTMTMSSGSLWIKKNISVGADATKLISINNGKISADEVQGNTFKFVNTGQSGGYRDITYDTVDTMIIKAEMDGNLLKLWKRGDSKDGNPSITFSKAVSLGGTWDGNRYTVTAKMDGVTLPNEDVVIPVVNPVGSSGGAYVDVYVATAKSSGSGYDNHGTAKTLYLVKNGLTVYLKSQNSTTSGEVYAQTTCSNPYPNTITVRQAVGFQSLRKFEAFYKPATGGDPVSLGTHYWYRSEKDLNKTQSDTTLRYA